MALCGALVLAFSVEAYAKEYLCPAIPSGSTNINDKCICSTTNWSKETLDVTTELLDADGNSLNDENGTPLGAVTVLLQPNSSTRVRAVAPFFTSPGCTCRVTIDTKKARVSLARRRTPGTVQFIGIVYCK